jgi:hypothetical protein
MMNQSLSQDYCKLLYEDLTAFARRGMQRRAGETFELSKFEGELFKVKPQ